MRYALALARANVRAGSGGPFAAMVVHDATQRIVSVGVNLVTTEQCSVLHAEIVAIIRASHAMQSWDLHANGATTLFTTAEPCAMCMGAIPWSGVRRVVIGARDQDVRSIGFDEGAKPEQWVKDLRGRGIDVVRDVLRDEAKQVLEQYVSGGGLIYNAVPPSSNIST
ncbi:MAG: nucleoside deaminase [Candidatus Kapabacteria bacterium]|nr:nucleoside deaminase [Candidatus Kapabacteria bacterium]